MRGVPRPKPGFSFCLYCVYLFRHRIWFLTMCKLWSIRLLRLFLIFRFVWWPIIIIIWNDTNWNFRRVILHCIPPIIHGTRLHVPSGVRCPIEYLHYYWRTSMKNLIRKHAAETVLMLGSAYGLNICKSIILLCPIEVTAFILYFTIYVLTILYKDLKE